MADFMAHRIRFWAGEIATIAQNKKPEHRPSFFVSLMQPDAGVNPASSVGFGDADPPAGSVPSRD
ncbi:hypothetical protein ACBY01_16720 [Sphingomonas sp. ac-8]|uniref:hypothetical protein n=1 Tax=Sphingomonas sp. ac-8 TaxID=3242977 RepID=UPI003A80B265